MPPVIAGVIATVAGSLGASLAVTAAISSIVTAVAGVALSVGLSLLVGLLAPRPQALKPSGVQREYQQSVPARVWHYGRVKAAGPLAAYENDGEDDNNWLVKAVLISARRIDAVETVYVDDRTISRDAEGWATNDRWQIDGVEDRVKVVEFFGTDTQAASTTLLEHIPSWTADHRLRGIAYLACLFKAPDPADFTRVYPNGEPTVKVKLRASLLYDPRLDSTVPGGSGTHRADDKETWAWSENAALAVLDYLIHPDGYNRPVAKIDIASFIVAANRADENVTLKAGGTEKRYRIATTITLAEKRTDVLRHLLAACDGQIVPTAFGRWAIRGGAWEEPTVVLDGEQGHIIEASFPNGVDALSRYNELAIQFNSPAHGYTETEGEPWQNAADIAATGIVETQPFDLVQVPSHGQARRLAKIRMARDNPEWTGELRTNFVGLDAIGERAVTIRWPELEIDGPFWIESASMLADGTGVTLKVRSAEPASYDWDAATEEGTPPPVPDD